MTKLKIHTSIMSEMATFDVSSPYTAFLQGQKMGFL